MNKSSALQQKVPPWDASLSKGLDHFSKLMGEQVRQRRVVYGGDEVSNVAACRLVPFQRLAAESSGF